MHSDHLIFSWLAAHWDGEMSEALQYVSWGLQLFQKWYFEFCVSCWLLSVARELLESHVGDVAGGLSCRSHIWAWRVISSGGNPSTHGFRPARCQNVPVFIFFLQRTAEKI